MRLGASRGMVDTEWDQMGGEDGRFKAGESRSRDDMGREGGEE